MSKERKADMEAALAELAFEIELAIKQGLMTDKFQWMTTCSGPPDANAEEHWFAVLTIGSVGK